MNNNIINVLHTDLNHYNYLKKNYIMIKLLLFIIKNNE